MSASRESTLRGRWLWLFPASYAVHIAEEGLAGERFYRWIRRVVHRELKGGVFVGLNLAFEVVMIAGVRQAQTRENAAWLVPALGTITATNGIGHAIGSVATRSYSPGLVSGLGVWAPLGVVAMSRARRVLPEADWRRGVLRGAMVQSGIAVLAWALSDPAQRRQTVRRAILP